uniref:Putative ATPase domain containing protein n=1 Tax=viral metagenome TaxID=1070528 RepID=A0A6M3K2H4_9ZZZZ
MSENERLEIEAEAKKLQKMYQDDPRSKSFNAIIYGGFGTGKSSLLRTCRRPILVDSFDPGGSKVLDGYMDIKGWPEEYKLDDEIYKDTRFEVEDPSRPTAAKLWDEEYHRRKRMGFFDQIGTYAVDSMTTLAQDIMYSIMQKAGRAGGTPFQQDWLPQMTVIENFMRDMVSLPCDCILIGHDDADKDEATGRMFIGLMITGKLKRRVPLLFDEIYSAQTNETSSGIEYKLLTRSTGLYQARTRLGKGGELDTYEKPDIKNILRKVGLPTEDKPRLINSTKEQ